MNKEALCNALGACSDPTLTNEDDCVAKGVCVEDDAGVVPADALDVTDNPDSCTELGTCHITAACTTAAQENGDTRCAGDSTGDLLSSEAECQVPPVSGFTTDAT